MFILSLSLFNVFVTSDSKSIVMLIDAIVRPVHLIISKIITSSAMPVSPSNDSFGPLESAACLQNIHHHLAIFVARQLQLDSDGSRLLA